MLSFAAITPHPPIIVPEIGKGELGKCQPTVRAMQKLGESFNASEADAMVIVSPHSPTDPLSFLINTSEELSGDLGQFGASEVGFKLEGIGKSFGENIEGQAWEGFENPDLDHGILVPLSYLFKARQTPIAPISFSMQDSKTQFEFGKAVGKAIKESEENFAFVASGDLSHRLTQDAPAGFSPRGKEFDDQLVAMVKENDVEEILNMDDSLLGEAGECGYRSIAILLGVLSNFKYEVEVLSYEGPFGVGYLVAEFKAK